MSVLSNGTALDRDPLEAVRAIYDDAYAEQYEALYITPWGRKHQFNEQYLSALFSGLRTPTPSWLDLACGQAWHFSRFAGRARMLGVDASAAQLERARRQAPHADYLQADISTLEFREPCFDLITSFWGAYCYLGNRARIEALLRRMPSWIKPSGALYLEALLPEDLASFGQSQYAARTGFKVVPLSEDYRDWAYDDIGGRHVMHSPEASLFLETFTPYFREVQAVHDGGFMMHVLATGRLDM